MTIPYSFNEPEPRPCDKIIGLIYRFYDVSLASLISPSRRRKYTVPRMMCMYFMERYTDLTLKKIGAEFGNRDHSTVIHARKTVMNLYETNATIRAEVIQIEEKIEVLLNLNQDAATH